MAVANAWGLRNAVPPRQFCSCFDSVVNKGSNLNFAGSILNKYMWRSVKNSSLSCRCSNSLDWDWNRWSRHFSEVEQADNFSSLLKFQLEDAIEKEDFEEAAKLKAAIAEATSKDAIAEIMLQLKNAIDEERYRDASVLCKLTGSGLVGWWVGCSKDSDDPFGKLVQISPGVGRFVARSYSPRQLVTATPGTPLFEIFVVKDSNNTYIMQVVCLQRAKERPSNSTLSTSKSSNGPTTSATDSSAEDISVDEEDEVEKLEKSANNVKDASEEGIESVIDFLKDKIPGLKVKVMNINVPEEIVEGSDSVEQPMQEDNEKAGSADNSADKVDLGEIHHEGVAPGGDTNTREEENNMAMKVFIGGLLHNNEDTPSEDGFMRFPAEIKDIEKDSFVLHVPRRSEDSDIGERKVSRVRVAAIATNGVSELMPLDVAKEFWGVDKVPSKVSRDVREIVKLAVSQAQKRNRLSGTTIFTWITTPRNDLDPFDGLYVGAFGPYGTEVVQLRRKFGDWNGVDDTDKRSDVEFFEYVEAVKLTGDLNVPAGQVTFRAKIGKGSRIPNSGMYPDELGVVASYKGQGRIAEFGFKNPQWVDGELLQLSGRGMEPYARGADLGFLYVVPQQSFLVLFNRLKLPE
ncbi:PREDICTED: protein EXECUTER 2, chloroplastic-like [Nelumbo nucifera]|uniref:Protein EXECUTER 2, chloroplastic-like n=1 Tax=Nelumbo nucifera TaxID=4432 RepID=A0A1U7ZRB0_NELNU|nr:PREDICTED: protein EXECUTER 2, chloroplastic-like [Nelumbo nucifera]